MLLKVFNEIGFKTNDISKVFTSVEELLQYYEKVFSMRRELDYDIDGIVYKVNNFSLQQRLGFRSSSPRWAIAHKFPAQLSITIIEDIEIQIGRTGTLSPVAKLKPVNIGGVIVSSATLHNRDFIMGLDNKGNKIRDGADIRKGDWVTVYRAGDVIPKIKDVDMGSTPGCMDIHGGNPKSETLVLGDDNSIANILVRVRRGLPTTASYTTPSDIAEVDQYGCVYKPHVLAIQKGQSISYKNSDVVPHNVHTLSEANPAFNKAVNVGGKPIDRTYDAEELFFVKCDIHPWMKCWVHVLSLIHI